MKEVISLVHSAGLQYFLYKVMGKVINTRFCSFSSPGCGVIAVNREQGSISSAAPFPAGLVSQYTLFTPGAMQPIFMEIKDENIKI